MASNSEELARLAQLRDQGVLTEDEFQAQKAAVLAGERPAAVGEPPTKGKSKFGIGCLVVLGIIVLLGIIGALAGGVGDGNSSEATSAPATPPVEVTAVELFDAYQSNEAAAQQRFGSSRLLVSGTVDGVDLDLTDDPVVRLRTSNEFMHASANLTDASKPKASTLQKGRPIQVLCASVTEIMGMPQLKDCDIQ